MFGFKSDPRFQDQPCKKKILSTIRLKEDRDGFFKLLKYRVVSRSQSIMCFLLTTLLSFNSLYCWVIPYLYMILEILQAPPERILGEFTDCKAAKNKTLKNPEIPKVIRGAFSQKCKNLASKSVRGFTEAQVYSFKSF